MTMVRKAMLLGMCGFLSAPLGAMMKGGNPGGEDDRGFVCVMGGAHENLNVDEQANAIALGKQRVAVEETVRCLLDLEGKDPDTPYDLKGLAQRLSDWIWRKHPVRLQALERPVKDWSVIPDGEQLSFMNIMDPLEAAVSAQWIHTPAGDRKPVNFAADFMPALQVLSAEELVKLKAAGLVPEHRAP